MEESGVRGGKTGRIRREIKRERRKKRQKRRKRKWVGGKREEWGERRRRKYRRIKRRSRGRERMRGKRKREEDQIWRSRKRKRGGRGGRRVHCRRNYEFKVSNWTATARLALRALWQSDTTVWVSGRTRLQIRVARLQSQEQHQGDFYIHQEAPWISWDSVRGTRETWKACNLNALAC